MTHATTHLRAMLLIITAGALLASCATQEMSESKEGSDHRTFVIALGGSPEQWAEFDKALRGQISEDRFACKVSDEGEKVSTCESLQKKGAVPSNATVTYAFLDELPKVMKKVGRAIDQVSNPQGFSVTTRVVALTCSSPCTYIQGCGNWCVYPRTCHICFPAVPSAVSPAKY
jgi:hypothetical protein